MASKSCSAIKYRIYQEDRTTHNANPDQPGRGILRRGQDDHGEQGHHAY